MHIQIINFNLSGISRSEYEAAAAEAAQPISEMPGLISKRWLANEETNTYGGVYFWETKQQCRTGWTPRFSRISGPIRHLQTPRSQILK